MIPQPSHTARPTGVVPFLVLITFLMTFIPTQARAGQAGPDPEAAPLLVTWQTVDGETFRAIVSDAASLERVTAALADDGYAGIPLGTLAHGDGGVNAPHAWHLLDVTVVDMTIELCDGTVSMVDADVEYWVDVVGSFCPWSAIVVEAEPFQPGPIPTTRPATEPAPAPTVAGTEVPSGTATATPAVPLPVESPPAKETEPGLPPATTAPPSAGANGPAIALPDTGSGTGEAGSPFPRLLLATNAVMSLLLLVCLLASSRGLHPRPSVDDTG
jgi:hypothetical protein